MKIPTRYPGPHEMAIPFIKLSLYHLHMYIILCRILVHSCNLPTHKYINCVTPQRKIKRYTRMASLFPPNHGPLLANFSSLLVKGPYPSACPLNLALSFPNPDRSIIILACSGRENSGNSLRASLQGLKLTGKISAQTERVQILYVSLGTNYQKIGKS